MKIIDFMQDAKIEDGGRDCILHTKKGLKKKRINDNMFIWLASYLKVEIHL